jgi:hypothetical protein
VLDAIQGVGLGMILLQVSNNTFWDRNSYLYYCRH